MSRSGRIERLWSELRRRKVVQVTIAYSVVAWGLIEFSSTIEEPLALPAWTDTLVIILMGIGLPIAVILSWIFDIGPGGVTTTDGERETTDDGASVAVSSHDTSREDHTATEGGLVLADAGLSDAELLDVEVPDTEPPDPEPLPDDEPSETEEPSAATLAEGGERRKATILWAELAGRSALEESLSPTETDRLLEDCRDAMESVVLQHEGVINLNTGETLQALFGIPSAHEDDATRGVRAAGELCRSIEAVLGDTSRSGAVGLRCGLDTGNTVVRPDPESEAYRVVGEPAERSSRLAAQAETGQVLVSEATCRVVSPFFEFEAGDELPGRGDHGSTATFRLAGETGVRTRLEAAATAGLTTLVGRDAELAALTQACEAAVSGAGSLVSIVGDAGVGKSRLLYELRRTIDDGRFVVVRGRCEPFGTDVPYLPFIEILRERLGLTDLDGSETEQIVAERVRKISTDLEDFMPFFRELLSIGGGEHALHEAVGSDQLRFGLVESLSALVTLGARETPTVVVVEDWHWVDSASRQVLRQLAEMVSAYALVVIVTARPEADVDLASHPGIVPINLGPLSPDDSADVIRSVMNAHDVPTELTEFLHERTGGNPFFLEEVCESLREEGTLLTDGDGVRVVGSLADHELPDNVQGVIRTRLDRLDGDERKLVRYASVIGPEFGLDVLEHALEGDAGMVAGLERLRELGLIHQIRVVPTPTYRFRHALTRDVAKDGLLERQRADVHGAVGDAIEALYPERLDDQLDRLADHFAAAARWEKAVDYGVAAANRLWSLSEFQDAVELQARALEWVRHFEDEGKRSERRTELLLGQERLFEYLGLRDRQQSIIDELKSTLDPDTHPEALATAFIRQGDLSILTHDYDEAEKAVEAALQLSDQIGDLSIERAALRTMGFLLWRQDRYSDAVAIAERGLHLDRELKNREAEVGSLGNLGAIHRALGEYERALEYLEEGLRIERTLKERRPGVVAKESYILHVMGSIYTSLGDSDKAREYMLAAQAVVEESNMAADVVQEHFHLNALARLTLSEGRIEEALDLYRQSVTLCRDSGHLDGLSATLRLVGEVLLTLEQHEEACPLLAEAADLFAGLHDRASEGRMWRGVAISSEALNRSQAALEGWVKAAAIAAELGSDALELEAAEGMARMLKSTDPIAAKHAYDRALELAIAEGEVARTGSLHYAIGTLHWGADAYEDALTSFDAAYERLTTAGKAGLAGLALNSVGRTLRDLERFDEAKTRLAESAKLNQEAGETLYEAHALATLGDVLLDAGEADQAVEHFTAALQLRKRLDDVEGQGWMTVRLAKAQSALGSPDGVAYYLAEAEEIASRTGDVALSRECEALRQAD